MFVTFARVSDGAWNFQLGAIASGFGAENEAYNRVWAEALSEVHAGVECWSGGQGAEPAEAESFLAFGCSKDPASLPPFRNFCKLRKRRRL